MKRRATRHQRRDPRSPAGSRAGAAIAVAGPLIALALFASGVAGSLVQTLLIIGAGGVLLVTGIVMMLVALYRMYTLLEREARRVCPECHYPLPRGVSDGTCPECGLGYNLESVRVLWANWLHEQSTQPVRRPQRPR